MILLMFHCCSFSQTDSVTFKNDDGVWVTTDRSFFELKELPNNLNFVENSAKLTDASINYLNSYLPGWSNLIESEKLESINLDFGSRTLDSQRAQAVVNYFITNGADPNKIGVVGYGESNPYQIKDYELLLDYDFDIPEQNFEIKSIEDLESYGKRLELSSPEEEKVNRISFLIKNKDEILYQCTDSLVKPISPNKFSGITLYGYSKIDGSIDLGFFKKIFNASAKIDKYKSQYLNGFYEDEYCECQIGDNTYKVKVAWFFGVVNDMEVENKGGKLKISGIDFVSAAVTMNRASVKSSIYTLGLYNMNSEPPYDITSFDVKEYSKFNSYVNSFLDLRKKIPTNETTFDPELILLEWYELTK